MLGRNNEVISEFKFTLALVLSGKLGSHIEVEAKNFSSLQSRERENWASPGKRAQA